MALDQATQRGLNDEDDEEDPDALDKIVRDEHLEREGANSEDRRRGNLDEQDDTGIPRPSEDGDTDADMDEPGAGKHETS